MRSDSARRRERMRMPMLISWPAGWRRGRRGHWPFSGRELIDFIKSLMVGRSESQEETQTFTPLIGLKHLMHNTDLLAIITDVVTVTHSPLNGYKIRLPSNSHAELIWQIHLSLPQLNLHRPALGIKKRKSDGYKYCKDINLLQNKCWDQVVSNEGK